MNWYRMAQFVPNRSKGKLDARPEWEREYETSALMDKEVYPGILDRPMGMKYTDYEYRKNPTDRRWIWAITLDGKFHMKELEGSKNMYHFQWKEVFPDEDTFHAGKYLACGRCVDRGDGMECAVSINYERRSDAEIHRVFDIVKKNMPAGTRIYDFQ